jgi:hypothetical protein
VSELFVGGLNVSRALYRLVLNGIEVTATEALFAGQHERRDVRQEPDGYLFVMSRTANAEALRRRAGRPLVAGAAQNSGTRPP